VRIAWAGVTGRDHVEHSLSEACGPSLSLSRTGLTRPSLLRLGLRIILGITLLQSHHVVDSAEGETQGTGCTRWLIAQILLRHTYGGLNIGCSPGKWVLATGQCSHLESLPPRTQTCRNIVGPLQSGI
jgi:hypothetical protein